MCEVSTHTENRLENCAFFLTNRVKSFIIYYLAPNGFTKVFSSYEVIARNTLWTGQFHTHTL